MLIVSCPGQVDQSQTLNERTGHVIKVEKNIMQQELDNLHSFTNKKLLKIKEKKTTIMKFNFSKNYDFPPELEINGFKNQIEVVKETKLLGVVVTDNLKWAANTEAICKKAYKNMWQLRRMKLLDVIHSSCWMCI